MRNIFVNSIFNSIDFLSQACAWFLEIAFVHKVCMCVWVVATYITKLFMEEFQVVNSSYTTIYRRVLSYAFSIYYGRVLSHLLLS